MHLQGSIEGRRGLIIKRILMFIIAVVVLYSLFGTLKSWVKDSMEYTGWWEEPNKPSEAATVKEAQVGLVNIQNKEVVTWMI